MIKDENVTIAVVLPKSMVEWLDKTGKANDQNRSQVVRAKLRIAKQVEGNSVLLSKTKVKK